MVAASREAWRAFGEGYRTGIKEPRSPILDLGSVPRGEAWLERHLMTPPSSLTIPVIPEDEDGPFGHHWAARYVYELGPGRIDALSGLVFVADSVVAQSGPPLRDLSWVAAIAGSGRRLRDEQQARREVSGPVLPLGRDPITGYYHWTVDFLPRILHALRLHPDLTVVAPKIKAFVRGCLDALDVPFIETDDIVEASNIILADHTDPEWCHPEDAAILRDLGASLAVPSSDIERLYVSRRGARRSMEQEDLLEESLRTHGFFIADGRSFPDYRSQVAAFSGARLVVGPHGAGLANMVWATAGATVVEISVSPSDATPSDERSSVAEFFRTRLFRNLAAACGHHHERVIVPSLASATYGRASDAKARILELLR